MVITEVRIKLMEDNNENERLQAFCSVTFDDAFVVRDLKIIEGTKGSFVAMPSRKLTDRCPQLRLQEPPAGPLLQPVRRQARRGPRHPRRRRPGQAARRHRPPDQLGLPRGDPVGRPQGVPGGARTLQAARLRLHLRRLRQRLRRDQLHPGRRRDGRRAPRLPHARRPRLARPPRARPSPPPETTQPPARTSSPKASARAFCKRSLSTPARSASDGDALARTPGRFHISTLIPSILVYPFCYNLRRPVVRLNEDAPNRITPTEVPSVKRFLVAARAVLTATGFIPAARADIAAPFRRRRRSPPRRSNWSSFWTRASSRRTCESRRTCFRRRRKPRRVRKPASSRRRLSSRVLP